jgi:hypothetical protein
MLTPFPLFPSFLRVKVMVAVKVLLPNLAVIGIGTFPGRCLVGL